MKLAIVYSLAVDPAVTPVVGAPSFGVLSRQIPRMVVGLLNGEGDQGLRFFPLLGERDGRRQFFMVSDMLSPEQLVKIHGQKGDVQFVVDGRIDDSGVRIRIIDAGAVREVLDQTWPMDPLDPMAVVTRLVYELSGLLGLEGPLPKIPDLRVPELSYFLVAKDDLLSLEAGFDSECQDHWLQAISKVTQSSLGEPEVQALVLDLCRHLAASNKDRQEAVEFLTATVAQVEESAFLSEAAVVLRDLGDDKAAEAILDRLVGEELADEAAVLRLVSHLFENGRHEESRRQLEIALELGPRLPLLLAQLMVTYQRLGMPDEERAVASELAQRHDLPVAVGRVLCGELIDFEMIEDAVFVACRCLEKEPENANLWIGLGRAFLHTGAPGKANDAFDTALSHDSSASVRSEVDRLRRFANLPGVLPELEALDGALSAGDLEKALVLAQRLTVDHETLSEGWLFLGVVHQRLEQSDLAIAGFEQALRLNSDFGEAHNRLGILLVGLASYQKGYDHLQRAVALLEHDPGPWIHLAQACFYLEKADEGRAALAQATRLGAKAEVVESVRRAFFAENS